jgi:hypothetical protein
VAEKRSEQAGSRLQPGLTLLGCAGCGLLLGAGDAFAETAGTADDAEGAPIVVTAPIELVNAVPERSLDSSDVEAYGLDTVGEVIDEIAGEDGEGRDDIIFLVNGKRVAGPGDVADLPAEAIAAIDVLPPGSGVKVGANPRQRVYNLQLRSKLDLATARAAGRAATRGGWTAARADIGHTHIRGPRRITAKAKAERDALLRESEREVIQPAGAIADAGRFRSLAPAGDRIDLSLAAADRLTPWLEGSLNAKLSTSERNSLLGAFAPAGIAEGALEQQSRNLAASTDLALSAQTGSWSIGLFGNYAYQRRRTATDRVAAEASEPLVSRTLSRSESIGGEVTAFGPLIELPAGQSVVTVAAGATSDRIEGERSFMGTASAHATRQTLTTLRADLEVPIASEAAGVLGFLGELSASAELARQHASDFGSFDNRTLTLLWRPFGPLLLTGSISRSDSPPPIASQDEPPIETPGVRTFDPLRGETVDVTLITGGIGGLRAQSDDTMRISAKLRPSRKLGLQLTGDYSETSYRNQVSELPTTSLAILEAFPDRFVRDANGRLIVVDARPVQFASRDRRQLRTGVMLTLPLGNSKGGSAGAAEGADGDDDGGEARPARFGIRPRLQITAAHTWLLDSELTIREGGPAIDLLSREAIGFGGLGQPRHRFDLALGYAGRGLGVRATTQHRSESFIDAGGPTANVFRFRPLTTFALRAWVQGERLDPGGSWLKGARLSLSVTNLTDVREKVADRFGVTPLSYQPAYRDPIGRTVEIELRKKF